MQLSHNNFSPIIHDDKKISKNIPNSGACFSNVTNPGKDEFCDDLEVFCALLATLGELPKWLFVVFHPLEWTQLIILC